LDIVQEDNDILDIINVDESELLDVQNDSDLEENDDITALQNLLKALSDKNVVASLKGMKININITLGDKNEQ